MDKPELEARIQELKSDLDVIQKYLNDQETPDEAEALKQYSDKLAQLITDAQTFKVKDINGLFGGAEFDAYISDKLKLPLEAYSTDTTWAGIIVSYLDILWKFSTSVKLVFNLTKKEHWVGRIDKETEQGLKISNNLFTTTGTYSEVVCRMALWGQAYFAQFGTDITAKF